ncbi:MAG: hypothetical protein PHT31_01065 [Candidatus Omnitrophica bacterium]|nr:hypothetical protein [Candidatus Omnitrophota bacterium]MDD5652736.1 hypothetical protein [Candidatus Omnitrophota bacterium]
MRGKRFSVLCLMLALFFYAQASAEVIALKSGKKIEGKIIERKDNYLTIDFEGVALPYFYEDIETIDGEPLSPAQPSPAIDTPLAQEPQTQRKAPFTTAIVHYKMSANNVSGRQIAYIDLAKNKIILDSEAERNDSGVITKNINREIAEGQKITRVDLNKKIGSVFEGNTRDALANVFNEEAFRPYYKGKKFILGKECKLYKAEQEELCFWEGVLLKEELFDPSSKRSFVREAVKLSLDIPIDETKLGVPEGTKMVASEEFFKIINPQLQAQETEVNADDLSNIIEDAKKTKEEISEIP